MGKKTSIAIALTAIAWTASAEDAGSPPDAGLKSVVIDRYFAVFGEDELDSCMHDRLTIEGVPAEAEPRIREAAQTAPTGMTALRQQTCEEAFRDRRALATCEYEVSNHPDGGRAWRSAVKRWYYDYDTLDRGMRLCLSDGGRWERIQRAR